MKIIYQGYLNRKVRPAHEWDSKVKDAIKKALELVEGKHGFRTPFEVWRNCELAITIGHNIYTTSIEIRPPEIALIKRRANWHNGYAYFSDGVFWRISAGLK